MELTHGIRWLCSPFDAVIPFPDASVLQSSAALDEIMETCARVKPPQVGCWRANEEESSAFGAKLMARGFEWGWQPRWLALDLEDDHIGKSSSDVEVHLDTSGCRGTSKLPYFSQFEAGLVGNLVHSQPPNTWRFIVMDDRRVVGHAVAHIAAPAPHVVGIYSVGVDEEYRNRGIGRAVTLACAEQGSQMGCRYAVLNASNPFYEKFGFRTLGHGQTWWMHANERGYICSPTAVAFAEAVAAGDLATLAAFADEQELLTQPLRCGLTAVGLAAHFAQQECGEWLVNHGGTCDILALWDLQLLDKISEMLHSNTVCLNEKQGRSGATLLHYAVLRNDIGLVRLLLSTNPDLTITDDEAHSTPLGWAYYFQRHEIAELI